MNEKIYILSDIVKISKVIDQLSHIKFARISINNFLTEMIFKCKSMSGFLNPYIAFSCKIVGKSSLILRLYLVSTGNKVFVSFYHIILLFYQERIFRFQKD